MTILEDLIAEGVPSEIADKICRRRGLDPSDYPEREVLNSRAYRLCEADVLKYKSEAANVSEGGVSITQADRNILINSANAIYSIYSEPLIGQQPQPTVKFVSLR